MSALTLDAAQSGQTQPTGFLLEPLGWVRDYLDGDSQLLAALVGLELYRVHLLAMALAHIRGEPSSQRVASFITQSDDAILEQALGRRQIGISRALRALPGAVLSRESYRLLVTLLADPATAKFLHHCPSVNEPLIDALAALPSPLRQPAIFKLFDRIEGMDWFVEGLKFLSARCGMPFDKLIADLAALNQTDQVVARITRLVDGLPLVEGLPKPKIGSFHRVDSLSEIRLIATGWRNCLAEYLYAVNECTGAIYLSADDHSPAVAFLVRIDRLGWTVRQIKGPRNVDIKPIKATEHREAFRNAGIPMAYEVSALKSILMRKRWLRQNDDWFL